MTVGALAEIIVSADEIRAVLSPILKWVTSL
ncbi:hypothetical protein BMS3Bbin04_01304 [bacterium BMS3Bbin04]|nr:hypothetical protein BMS3Bbin04_01304 [bacterium BMS3Bbin04]